MKRNKFLIATMGPGETAQGIALSKYLIKKGQRVVFATRLRLNKQFLKGKVFLIETPDKFEKVLRKQKPNVLVLCNSKLVSYYAFLRKPPIPKPVTVSLDSNWLFQKQGGWYYIPEWIDKYFIVFPKQVFNKGLKKYGGNYDIPNDIMKKIETVGFIPSYKKPSLKQTKIIREKYKAEKLIFAYFSGFGAGFRFWALENLVKAVEPLRDQGYDIKVIYVGQKDPVIYKKKWVIRKDMLPEKEFFLTLASSDLLFQHQGLGTLAQAISSQTPVIVNVKDLKEEPFKNNAHAWEVSPFKELNLCKMFYRSTPIKEIRKQIKELLYNKQEIEKMKKAQIKHYQAGEPKVYKTIKQLL